jgi:hypothetical protein
MNANNRSKQKPRATEPSARMKLSAAFTKALQDDFQMNGVEVIERLRKSDPGKYLEISAKLISTIEPKADGYESAKSMEDIGRKLLQSIGFSEPDPASIQEAVELNNTLVDGLQAIRARAEGAMQ